MASDNNHNNQKLLCLNILGYKKEGIDLAEYRNYMANVHAPLVAGLMQKYGFLQWSMVSNPREAHNTNKTPLLRLTENLTPAQTHTTPESPELMP